VQAPLPLALRSVPAVCTDARMLHARPHQGTCIAAGTMPCRTGVLAETCWGVVHVRGCELRRRCCMLHAACCGEGRHPAGS
jgi:hypothetical protein